LKELIYPRDRALTAVTMILGVAIWIVAVWGIVAIGGARAVGVTLATVVLVAAFSALAYLFARSAFIAHLRGNGIEVSEGQFPELHAQFLQCCSRLSISQRPGFYILNGNGVLNAFATWFLGRKYVVLLSSVVDAMEENPNGVRFYIGHELGHVVRHDNPFQWALRWPAVRFPLIGAAFSRARESTCDLHGMACSESREGAARSLIALLAGARRWKAASLEGISAQLSSSRGFWASFHELTASYPWSSKRVIRVLHEDADIPGRNPFAYVLAAFVPYAGRVGSGLGVLLYVYVIGVLAAIAIPAYQDYTARAVLTVAMQESQHARDALVASYQATGHIPESLAAVGVQESAPHGVTLSLNSKGMVLTVASPKGTLVFTPRQSRDGAIVWTCSAGSQMRPGQLPPACR